jgi:hypothetical protein
MLNHLTKNLILLFTITCCGLAGCHTEIERKGCVAYFATNRNFDDLPCELPLGEDTFLEQCTISYAKGRVAPPGFDTELVIGFVTKCRGNSRKEIELELHRVVCGELDPHGVLTDFIIPN